MGQAWVGDTVRAGVPKSAQVESQGYGYAVWVSEETNVQAILSTEYGAHQTASIYTDTGLSSGYYGVRRGKDGDWIVTH